MNQKLSSSSAICLALATTTIACYWPIFLSDFVSIDDGGYVQNNPHVLKGFTKAGWWYAWTSTELANWHPLTMLSLELDGVFWGRNPMGYHVTNVVFHVFNTLLLFCTMRRFSNNLTKNACVAFLFAVHPLHVESVAWISERKDVLSTFFLLLTMISYFRYAGHPSIRGYLLVTTCFSLGLLSKPMLVTVPILLIMLDVWPLNRVAWDNSNNNNRPEDSFQRPMSRLLLEKAPLFLLAFFDGIITMVAQSEGFAPLVRLTIAVRIANAFHAYLCYLFKTFAPINLCIFYPHPERLISSWLTVAEVLAFAAITGLTIAFRKSRPQWLFGWSWFVVSLLPVIGLLQVGGQSYADRYTYIPHIGLFVAIVWEGFTLGSTTKFRSAFLGVVMTAGIVICAVLTRIQVTYWKNNESLWSHAIAVDSENYFAHEHLIDLRMAEGKYEQAIAHCQRVVDIDRSLLLANTLCNWGRCLNALQHPEEAERKFVAAIKLDKNHEPSLYELSEVLLKLGRTAEAAQVAEQHAAVSIWRVRNQPENPQSQISLGLALMRNGNPQQAVACFEKAAQMAPDSVEALANLGMVQIQLNRLEQAKSSFMRVLKLNPNLPAIHFCLAQILEREHDFPNARRHFAEALRLNPDDEDAKKWLERLSNL